MCTKNSAWVHHFWCILKNCVLGRGMYQPNLKHMGNPPVMPVIHLGNDY